jgi:hypothetical protein
MFATRKPAPPDHYPFTRRRIASDRSARLRGRVRIGAAAALPILVGYLVGDLLAGVAVGVLSSAFVYRLFVRR